MSFGLPACGMAVESVPQVASNEAGIETPIKQEITPTLDARVTLPETSIKLGFIGKEAGSREAEPMTVFDASPDANDSGPMLDSSPEASEDSGNADAMADAACDINSIPFPPWGQDNDAWCQYEVKAYNAQRALYDCQYPDAGYSTAKGGNMLTTWLTECQDQLKVKNCPTSYYSQCPGAQQFN